MTRRGSGRAAARASRSPGPNAHLPRNLVLAAFLATIVALVAFALNPHGRVWGFNHWAYWGRGFPALFAAGCVAMLAVAAKFWGIGGARATARSAATPTPAQAMAAQAMAVHASRLRTFLLLVAAGAAGALLFSLARARTHFLGDGYQSISLLATDPSAMRATAPLLKLVLPHVRPLFGQDAEAAALRTYQVLSIVSGVLFVLVVASFSRLLLSATRDRVLFTLSAVCGGFSLLFFGYVENYAPFIAFTAATFLAGIAVLEGRMQRIGLIIPALFMMSMHVFAALALPAVAFALFHASRLHFWARAHRLLAGNILLAAGAGAGIILFRWAQADPRIPVALLPLIPTWYTNEGYTLFSPKHLMDLANLLFVLFPGGAICAALALFSPRRFSLGTARFLFFALFAGALWFGVFLLSPELGMPRDWDLFAFAGVPLVLFTSLEILRLQSNEARLALAASIIVSAAVLGARVVEARVDRVAILQFRNDLQLDPAKGRNGYFHLIRHYRATGQDELAKRVIAEWEERYPERDIMRTAGELHRAGNDTEAIRLCKKVLALNPVNNEAYMVLGESYLMIGDYEAGRLASMRAVALSADRLTSTYNLGVSYAGLQKFPEAEKWLREALELSPNSFRVNLSYAVVWRKLGREDLFEKYLAKASKCEGAIPQVIEEATKIPTFSSDSSRAGA